MSAVMDIWNAILHVVHSADTITLVIMAVLAIAAGFITMDAASVVTTTVLALIFFAVVVYLRAILLQGANATAAFNADWHALAVLPTLTLMAYAIIFAVVIFIVSTVRNLTIG